MKRAWVKLFVYLNITVAIILASGNANASPFYFGAGHQEAKFRIVSHTYFGKAAGKPTTEMIQKDVAKKAKYIMGFMRYNKIQDAASFYPKYKLNVTSIELEGSQYKVNYELEAKGLFKPGLPYYTIAIPISHGSIYEKSLRKCEYGENVSSSSYWYHWMPLAEGCPLQENVDYVKIHVRLYYISNTTSSYPEYDRLLQNGELKISMLFGLADYDEKNWNPLDLKDSGAKDYRTQRDLLINRYKMSVRSWDENEIRKIYNPKAGTKLPFVEEFTKETPNGRIKIKMFFGNTGLYADSKAFHYFLADSLANDAVVIYRGHSGIGKNLSLSDIENSLGRKIKMSDKYQILFLGSCAPYAYYTDMFFSKKKSSSDPEGTKNLEIITYGDEAYFGADDSDRLMEALGQYMYYQSKTSYQKIITEKARFYLGVSGDEDNPTTP